MPAEAIVTIKEKQWIVDLAATIDELVTGLSKLPYLPQGTGMLFDLGSEQLITVTTQTMAFPIDIVFLDTDLKVTEVEHGVTPGNLMVSELPARYFLEVNDSETVGIVVGDQAVVQVYQPAEDTTTDWSAQLINLMSTMMVFGFMFLMMKGMAKAIFPGKKAISDHGD